MKAEWIADYDYRTDSIYKRPGCPKCKTPIFEEEDTGGYWCGYCEKEMELTEEMVKWIEDRKGIKTEMRDCDSCGGKKCLRVDYIKDDITLKWRVAGGGCDKCGMRFIV